MQTSMSYLKIKRYKNIEVGYQAGENKFISYNNRESIARYRGYSIWEN